MAKTKKKAKSKKKKGLKIVAILLGLLIVALISIPLLFEDKLMDLVKKTLNENLDAEVEFADADLSFIRSFPQASLKIEGLSITNKAPFEGDTLAYVGSVALDMSVKELFKDQSEAIKINSLIIDEALVNIKVDSLGNANYDIGKKTEGVAETDTTSSGGYTIDLEDYKILNSTIAYRDEAADMHLQLDNLNHSGLANVSSELSKLFTKTTAKATFGLGDTNYLENTTLDLDAVVGMDLKNNKYSFLENKALVNQLPLVFDGFVQINENDQDVDITFKTPSSEFKNFLGVIPNDYAKNLSGVTTTGDFTVNGMIKGKVDEEHIPKMNIDIASNNASFKYPDLPKGVKNITIKTQLKNDTGISKDTYVNIDALNFTIDQDHFKSSGKISNITGNPYINAALDGTLNLANLTKAYPIELENDLKGKLTTNLRTAFDVDAVQNNKYERIKNTGTATVTDFIFSSEDIVNPIDISEANIDFKPGTVALKKFNARTGESDINATGSIKNLLGFLFSDKKLQGNFDVTSDYFAVSDFMVEEVSAEGEERKTEEGETLKIPAFLDCTVSAEAKTVKYDNLQLNNVKGKLLLKDEKATLQNVTSSMFDGEIALNGSVSTKEETPVFDMALGINAFDISKSFDKLEMFQVLTPIANALQGKINTNLNVSGKLDEEFTPMLSTISGDALAEVITSKLMPKNSAVFNALANELSFINLDKLNLKDLKTKLSFADGKVYVKPFTLKYEDIDIEISGGHGFDKTVDYKATFNVPAKYLGSDINKLLSSLSPEDADKLSVPVTANITGNYTSPAVKTDLTSAVSNLTNQIIELQKEKLLGEGKDKVKDVIGDILGGNKKENDSTATDSSATKEDPVKDLVNDALGNLFGKKKKKKDSIPNN